MTADPQQITLHCAELNRCNQRGGRMLSILDLIDAETISLDLAAYLLTRMMAGASLMVGARPGGAGKTTVMCALLNLAPERAPLVAATAPALRDALREASPPRRCYVCHEIGAGRYFAYLWDADLRAFCSLREKGHVLATNLHAEDIDEAFAQVCDENRVPARHFNAFDLIVFLRVEGGRSGVRRYVERVYESAPGASSTATAPSQRLIYDRRHGLTHDRFVKRDSLALEREGKARAFLEQMLKTDARTIEETRRCLLAAAWV